MHDRNMTHLTAFRFTPTHAAARLPRAVRPDEVWPIRIHPRLDVASKLSKAQPWRGGRHFVRRSTFGLRGWPMCAPGGIQGRSRHDRTRASRQLPGYGVPGESGSGMRSRRRRDFAV